MGIKRFLRKAAPYLPIVGDVIGGMMASSAQKKANKANVRLQREQQDWEERMSNTSWQRGVQDMLAAGLNPMLAFSQGGASTPNVSAATVEPVEGMARGVTSAANKQAQILTLERMRIDNNIQKEKLSQEKLTTGEMTATKDPGQIARGIEQREAETRRAVSDARIREIERLIAEETMGANVSSAKARATILDKEVTYAELRNILAGLDIPEKQAMAKWFERVGEASPAAKAVMSISQWLKFILGR